MQSAKFKAQRHPFMTKRILFLFLVVVAAGAAVWGVVRFNAFKRLSLQQTASAVSNDIESASVADWNAAVEKVKADRGEQAGGAVQIPTELQHYSDRHWFLATQVAEVEQHHIQNCQDFIDLAAMIEARNFVLVPVVTENYVLYGVGERADDSVFGRYEDGQTIELYTETQLNDAYRLVDEKRLKTLNELEGLKPQNGDRTNRRERQKRINALQLDLKSVAEEKARLDQFYAQPESRQKLFRGYGALQTLARDFAGRSYNLDVPADRLALKLNLLRSLRPEAFNIMEEIASAYHQAFDRPLPVSSLVRPEEYQHALRKRNRNAVLIDTPPHSTGLAFDIDYRYMSAAEQQFLMNELARLKNEGRIEVLRERNANYHVFAFINGTRPVDELITASLEKAIEPGREANHVTSNEKSGTHKAKLRTAKRRSRGSSGHRHRR
jgi:hypothetical protein